VTQAAAALAAERLGDHGHSPPSGAVPTLAAFVNLAEAGTTRPYDGDRPAAAIAENIEAELRDAGVLIVSPEVARLDHYGYGHSSRHGAHCRKSGRSTPGLLSAAVTRSRTRFPRTDRGRFRLFSGGRRIEHFNPLAGRLCVCQPRLIAVESGIKELVDALAPTILEATVPT
jgi:hypothetical protein